MIKTEGQNALTPMEEPMEEMELIWKGKTLLTLEQWEKFAFCPNCYKQKCSACMSGPSGLTEVEQSAQFDLAVEDDDDDYIPRKLWDIAIQCCACGSRQHIVDWLEEAIMPGIYYFPEAEEAMIRAAKGQQEESLPEAMVGVDGHQYRSPESRRLHLYRVV